MLNEKKRKEKVNYEKMAKFILKAFEHIKVSDLV